MRPPEWPDFPIPEYVPITDSIDIIVQGMKYGDAYLAGRIAWKRMEKVSQTYWDACDSVHEAELMNYERRKAARKLAIAQAEKLEN